MVTELNMKTLIKLLSLTVVVVTLLCGATCRKQNVLYATTDALGSAVDKVMVVFSDYEVAKARIKLGSAASAVEIYDWVSADSAWKKVVEIHGQFLIAYQTWVSANALAVTQGTTADSQFRTEAINAATKLTLLIQSFIPTTKIIQ